MPVKKGVSPVCRYIRSEMIVKSLRFPLIYSSCFRNLSYLLLSVEGCDNLKLLTIAATTANPLPTIRQTAVLRSCVTKLKSKATNVVPVVCPKMSSIYCLYHKNLFL